jgi:hypothetical protein
MNMTRKCKLGSLEATVFSYAGRNCVVVLILVPYVKCWAVCRYAVEVCNMVYIFFPWGGVRLSPLRR